MRKAEERYATTMLEGAPWRSLVRFAIPVALGLVIQQLYSTVHSSHDTPG